MLFLGLGLFYIPFFILVVVYYRISQQLLLDNKYLCAQTTNANFQARKQVS